ncbi:MAG: hypothetical protein QM495_07585 [Lutibacter sp.]|uniref:hypothetical protein n=1 Tax=Lutibacter sp. TaxID=1925666 RepID=UPI00385C15D2
MKHLGIKLFGLLLLLVIASCTNHFEEGKKLFDNKDYDKSITEFKKVSESDDNYNQSQFLLMKADSLIEVIRRDKFVKDSIANVKEKIRRDSIAIVEKKLAIEKEIERLQVELKSIKSFNGSEYRGEVTSLTIEVALFSTWGKMAEEAKNHENLKIKKLGKSIEQNLKSLQLREFPKIRANYAKILKNKLWEENIEVKSFGSRKTTLQFTGGIFASNKNKKDFQTTLSQTFRDFRFKRVNYKWYEYDDEYTYYTISSDKDSKIKIY